MLCLVGESFQCHFLQRYDESSSGLASDLKGVPWSREDTAEVVISPQHGLHIRIFKGLLKKYSCLGSIPTKKKYIIISSREVQAQEAPGDCSVRPGLGTPVERGVY